MNANKMKSAQLKMLDNVLSIFKNKETVLDQRQAVKKDVAELKSVREDIATQLKAVKPLRPNICNKDTCRDKLKKSCAEYAPYLVRLGRDMEGNFLVETFNNLAAIRKTDASLTAFVGTLIEHLTDNLEDLEDVGITQEKIDALNDILEEFNDVTDSSNLQNKTNASFSIEADKQLTKALAVVREKLDISINSLRDIDAELFNLYQVARTVGKPSQKSTQLAITVMDALTQKPILNAFATVPFMKEAIKCDNEGVIYIKTGKKIDFEVMVTKPNFSEARFSIEKMKLKETRSVTVFLNATALPGGN